MAYANNFNFINIWRINRINTRYSGCPIHLYDFLVSTILGISAFYHDSAATLLVNGEIIAAAQEERFNRIKHYSGYPKNAVNFVLEKANKKIKDIDYIVFYEKPFLKFERLLETYVAFAPSGFWQFGKAIPLWIKEKLFQKKNLLDLLKQHDNSCNFENKIFFSEHHLSHAASAYYPSKFNEAIILTADGVGEWATTSVAIAKNEKIEIVKEIFFPHSLGLLYSSFTYYCGFKVNSGEYKLMGLAPYGEPKYEKLIKKKLIDIKNDGSFRLNQKYFNYCVGLTMINKNFENLFGKKSRNPEIDNIEQFHMDIASSIQKVTEDIILLMCKSLKKEFQIKNLCLAGGVALNCVANGKLIEKKIFKNLWIQPAAGDAGGSLGAALAFWHLELKKKRNLKNEHSQDEMKGSYLGPEYSEEEIIKDLNDLRANFEIIEENELLKKVALDISKNKVVGWFQGRMEFGPRALGNRSILADPRSPKMQRNLNLKIKFRESFRPFAPSILYEDLNYYFDTMVRSPYMLIVLKLKKILRKKVNINKTNYSLLENLNQIRSDIPAVTHVDFSARVQTVHKELNQKYYKLINEFKKLTGTPIVVNTSFNIRGEPIVNTPSDAYRCFMGTDMDVLVIGNCYLKKENQTLKIDKDYKNKYELD